MLFSNRIKTVRAELYGTNWAKHSISPGKASFSFKSLFGIPSKKHAMTYISWDGIISLVSIKLTRPATSLTPMAPTKDMSPLIFWKPSSKMIAQ